MMIIIIIMMMVVMKVVKVVMLMVLMKVARRRVVMFTRGLWYKGYGRGAQWAQTGWVQGFTRGPRADGCRGRK